MSAPVWEATRGEALTTGALTPTGTALLEYAERAGARLLVIDPTGIAMALPEIDRAAVSLALGTLRRWAQATGVTVLLVGHPAKAVEGEAADYSGSTAWLGSVRTLLTLRTPPPKGEAAATGTASNGGRWPAPMATSGSRCSPAARTTTARLATP